MMEILNKVTLKEAMVKPAKVKPVFIAARKGGNFGISEALFQLLACPFYVEFNYDPKTKTLYILKSTEETGFKVTVSEAARNFSFSCKPVSDRFFAPSQRYTVFTDPLNGWAASVEPHLFEIKLPK